MTQNKSSGNKFVKTKINKKKIMRLNILTLTGSFGGLFRTIRAESYNLKNKLLKFINIRQKRLQAHTLAHDINQAKTRICTICRNLSLEKGNVSQIQRALYWTSLCKYSISSAFGHKVPLGITPNLFEMLVSATDTGI